MVDGEGDDILWLDFKPVSLARLSALAAYAWELTQYAKQRLLELTGKGGRRKSEQSVILVNQGVLINPLL